jgi:hypothetical protein
VPVVEAHRFRAQRTGAPAAARIIAEFAGTEVPFTRMVGVP